MNKQELLEQLWELTVTKIIDKLVSGDYTSQDLNVARQMLKDHGVNVEDVEESPIGEVADLLPFRKTGND